MNVGAEMNDEIADGILRFPAPPPKLFDAQAAEAFVNP
jgi:hypothetical protein